MNKAMKETRKAMLKQKLEDPKYCETSYDRQMKKKKETYVDDRKRVA